MNHRLLTLARLLIIYIRWVIVALILLTLILGIIGFAERWAELLVHPESALTNFRNITEDIFSLLLVYEILDLIRTLSPNRLMDVILTVLARKILLSVNETQLAIDVVAFCAILLVRLLWSRLGKPEEETAPTNPTKHSGS
ncbi:hypothetical protein D2Q93_11030 [Alicyclobacillaceae bacterium I2511]|nr:hypothetical protein D2Q93_11030 [Alicyclobacillaceae bacterium I2511]